MVYIPELELENIKGLNTHKECPSCIHGRILIDFDGYDEGKLKITFRCSKCDKFYKSEDIDLGLNRFGSAVY